MEVAELVKQEVSKIAPQNEVILFGSRARGTHRKDSDWDFLILVDQEELTSEEKDELRDVLYDLELKLEEVISTIIHTKKDWENMSITPLYRIIEEEGLRA
jgi:predicted nucleotidyltransferase